MEQTKYLSVNEKITLIGRKQWIAFPHLAITAIKAKIDTGARTSALHAFQIEEFEERDRSRLRFLIHPLQRDDDTVIECRAAVADRPMDIVPRLQEIWKR